MKLRFEPLRRLCDQAVADQVAPGFVVLVASAGRVQFHQAFGRRQVVPRQLPAFQDTVYDVASVTKAVVTSVLAMKEVARGAIALDTPVATLLPEFTDSGAPGEGRAGVTVRHLLSHSSGLPAYRPFWQQAADAASERWAISLAAAREPLEYQPGTLSVYSDLGFILLGWLLERSSGLRLDALAARDIMGPLRLPSATFVNLAEADARVSLLAEHSVAATQQCTTRGRVVLGEVDDLNAYAMGGVAGHAGLFSNAADISAIAAALVAAWRGESGPSLVEREVIREFWSPARVPGSTWRLGWDGPAPQGSQAGARLSRQAVGHLGFTGCSLWIDPERETWVILLSNRVHPTVPDPDRLRVFRPALHDAVLEALGYEP